MNEGFNLEKGRVFRIRSRNLSYGVYDGHHGFIGIREKFGSRYLFTEYDWDQGAPYGTVQVVEDLGVLPEGIEAQERSPGAASTCEACGKRAWWTGPPGPAPWECESNCDDVAAVAPAENTMLFEFLDSLEK